VDYHLLGLDAYEGLRVLELFEVDPEDPQHDLADVLHGEVLGELGGRGDELLLHHPPQVDGGLAEGGDVVAGRGVEVALDGRFGELVAGHETVDVLHHYWFRRKHVHDEEVAFEAVGDVILSSAGIGHGADLVSLLDLAHFGFLTLLEDLESCVLQYLAHEFVGHLVTPFVDHGHAQVVDEEELTEVVLLGVQEGAFQLEFLEDGLLQQGGTCRLREVDALEQLLLGAFLSSCEEQDVGGLGGT